MDPFPYEDDLLAAIWRATRVGRAVNFASPDWFDTDHPITSDINDPNDWEGRTVRAEALRQLILDAARDEGTHTHGIQIRGLRIVGPMDLYNVRIKFPLRFHHCRFEDVISLGHARLETLEISQTAIRALAGRGVRIRGNLKMHYSVSAGPVVLEGAFIRGWADLWGIRVMCDGPGVKANATPPDLPPRLAEHYNEENEHAILLRVARIGNDLLLTDMKAGAPLHLEELIVGKRLFLDSADVAGRSTGGMSGHTANPDRHYAVKAGGMKVMGNAVLSASRFAGEVRLTGARVDGSLRLVGTRIESEHSRSLMLDRARIGGDLQFGDIKPYEPQESPDDAEGLSEASLSPVRPRTIFQGAVRMRKTEVRGDLNLSNTTLLSVAYPNGFALRATGAVVQGEMIAIHLDARGTVDLANSRVLRKIRIFNSAFAWAVDTQRELNAALEANHIHVASDLVIEQCRFDGPLYLQDADIRGTIYIKSSQFSGRDERGTHQDQSALAAERVRIGANFQIVDNWDGADLEGPARYRSRFIGGISLADARVDGGLFIHGGDYEGLSRDVAKDSQFGLTLEAEEAIHASGIVVERGIRIAGHAVLRGTINLEEATIEDEVRFERIICQHGRRGQAIRLTLSRIRGSLYLGSTNAPLTSAFVTERTAPEEAGFLPPERPVSLICLGQINISGSVIEGFVSLKGLHLRNPIDQGMNHHPGVETLAINANLAEIGKDLFIYRADPDETHFSRVALEHDTLRTDPFLVTVIGPISLEQAEIKGNLSLDRALFYSRDAAGIDQGPPGVAMGSTVLASAAKILRSVYFGPDFESHGEVNFARAEVSQSFVSEARHRGPVEAHNTVGRNVPRALACQGLQVGVSVELRHPFHAHGMADFTQATVYSTFRSLGATFEPMGKTALELPGAHIGRKLIFDRESCISGNLDLTAAQVDNDLEVWRDSFCHNPRPNTTPILRGRRMRISGTFFLGCSADRDVLDPQNDDSIHSVATDGSGGYVLDLTDATIGTLKDTIASWPDPGQLIINGLIYGRIAEGAPMDAHLRRNWLMRQPEAYLKDRFDPQPFDQIVRVLRQQGRPKGAEDLDVAKRTLRLKNRRNPLVWFLETITFRVAMRYGYRPWRVIFALFFVAALGGIVFNTAYNDIDPGQKSADSRMMTRCIAPADPEFYFSRTSPEKNFPPQDYPAFHPVHFSIDLIIPIMDLRQASYWIAASNEHCRGSTLYFYTDWDDEKAQDPDKTVIGTLPLGSWRVTMVYARNEVYWFKLYQSIQIVLGWFFTTLFAALITGLVQPRQQQGTGPV